MQPGAPADITGLLRRWSSGDQTALAELTPVVYEELRRIARRHRATERQAQTLNTTALVHETWLRLVKIKEVRWEDRAHFFALCAQLVRRILVDHARKRLRARRGGGVDFVSLEEGLLVSEQRSPTLLALDDALNALSALDVRLSRVVEMRFFGGLTAAEIAEVLNVSPERVKRDWRLARAWLARELSRPEAR